MVVYPAPVVIEERRVIYRDHLPPGLAKKFYGYEHVHWKHHGGTGKSLHRFTARSYRL